MDRRKFLKQVSLWSAGLIATPPVFNITPQIFALEDEKVAINGGEKPVVLVAKGQNYPAMVNKIVEKLGGMKAFVKKGDRVVIKPNIGWDRNIEQGANTHPKVVASLAQLCLDAGAKKVSVFDRTCNEERRCYTNSGIKSELKQINDKRLSLEYIDKRKFVPVEIKNGTTLKQWSFYKDALEADCYINVPVAKHHGLSQLSLGIKNIMGVIGGRRGGLHWGLEKKLADLNTVIRPTLTIIDASRVITANGPQGGSLADVKKLDTIIGTVDPVAADAYASTLFGYKPEDLDSTVEAHKKGLGQMDLKKCDIQYLKSFV